MVPAALAFGLVFILDSPTCIRTEPEASDRRRMAAIARAPVVTREIRFIDFPSQKVTGAGSRIPAMPDLAQSTRP